MTKRTFFPASPVDELTYCVEKFDKNPLIHGWIFTLEGEVCSRSLLAALEASLRQYPKFMCTMTRIYPSLQRWFRYCWEIREVNASDIFQEINDCGLNYRGLEAVTYYMEHYYALAMDISCQIPLKVILIRQPNQCSLIFVFHHAVADGISSFFFLQQFIQVYEDIFYQREKPVDRPPDFKAISQPDISFSWSMFSPKRVYSFLQYTHRLRKEPAAQLRPDGGEKGADTFLVVVRDIPPQQFIILRGSATKYRASINDYLLLCMFQTIKKWNHAHSGQSERFYITVPISLHNPADRTMGNIISGFNISLSSHAIGERAETITLIQKQLAAMLNNDIAATTFNLGWFMKLIPLSIKHIFYKRLPRLAAPTFSLSNLGVFSPNPSHIDDEGFHYMGPARISRVSITPPAGQWTGMVIATYNNMMTFSMTALRSHFSPEAVGTFVDSFIRELLS